MKKYIVHGKKWFDRQYGNTYNSVRVYDLDNKLIVALPFAYGCGDYYLQRVEEWLKKNNHPLVGRYYSEMFAYTCCEECLQREVKQWGMA